MSALLSARSQKQHRNSDHVPVSVIAVNSSPPPTPPLPLPPTADSREMFDVCSAGPYSSSSSSSADRHRNATAPSRWTGWSVDRPPSIDVWTASGDGGTTMKRSTSATLSNDSRALSSTLLQSPGYGSAQHLGSSVTFCNTMAAASSWGTRINAFVDLDAAEEVGVVRRSSSLNQAADVVLRPSGTPTTSATDVTQQQQKQQSRGKLALTLPMITCDGVASVPASPLRHVRSDVTGFGSTLQLHPGTMSLGGGSRAGGSSRTILVTPQGSFLSVNQSPVEFRESTISISYPNGLGAHPKPMS